jgi:immune inhibitor A
VRTSIRAVSAAAGLGLLVSLTTVAGPATAAPPSDLQPQAVSKTKADDSPDAPLPEKQAKQRATAFKKMLTGKATASGSNKVVKLAKGQYVELARTGEDTIWTVLAQFGTTINPTYGGTAGPVRNQIPEPDRTVDNTTIWKADFNRAHYENILFNDTPGAISMRNFYKEQSSNRYTVNGDVTDWVSVPNNEAYYGSNYCGSIVCARTWLFVRDSVNAWYASQVAAGKTAAEISASLAKYDVWDRYDYNGNGDFNEPDGYIDHFQSVHAGEGEETGGGAQGTDAIWSHRWYAFSQNIGFTGPAFNKFGGIKVGDTDLWIGDYTVEPENGGVGVFSHEFGHDLGLPDLYDTSGNTGGAENSTGFWTLYSSGSYGASGKPEDGIGTKPIPMSAYEKIFLGWSNYQAVNYKQKASIKVGPAYANTKQAQAIVAFLPDKKVSSNVGTPYAGTQFYYSGNGNDLDNTMTRSVALPAGTVSFSAKARYDIELDWDYAYLTVNGSPVATNRSTSTSPNGQNFGNGITGSSGGAWVDLTADLSAFASQTVTLGFRYWTDGAEVKSGLSVDDITITGLADDGAESDAGWSYAGFIRTTGTAESSYFNAYFAEYRTYAGYDAGLKTSPYNFGFLDNPDLQNQVEHFPYQDGLLVWYYDTSFTDNNVGDNCLAERCGGLVLPVDAHPSLLLRPNGQVWRPRVQSYDSTFGLDRTDKITLNVSSVPTTYGGLPAVPTFNDMTSYWVAPNPAIGNFGWSSVPLPKTGTKLRVDSINSAGFMQVSVNPN